MTHKRNTLQANKTRTKLADEHAIDVYKELEVLLANNASYRLMVYYLNTRTDLRTRRENEWTADSLWRLIQRVKDRNLCP